MLEQNERGTKYTTNSGRISQKKNFAPSPDLLSTEFTIHTTTLIQPHHRFTTIHCETTSPDSATPPNLCRNFLGRTSLFLLRRQCNKKKKKKGKREQEGGCFCFIFLFFFFSEFAVV